MRAERWALAVAWLVPISLYVWVQQMPQPLLDEVVHAEQVELFLDEGWAPHPRLTMVPGLHVLAAGLAKLTGTRSLVLLRGIGLVGALAFLLAGWTLARRLTPGRVAPRTLQLATLPLAAPLFPLFYTDVIGAALLLGAYVATLRRRFVLAALACASMVLVRHSLAGFVVWLALVGVSETPRRWRSVLPLAAPLALFGALLLAMGGATFGDHEFHPEGLSAGNLPFAVTIGIVLFLPSHLLALPKVWALLRDRPELAAVLIAVGACLAVGATADHPFNARDIDYTLYNRWVEWLFDTATGRGVLFAASVWAPLSFATFGWRASCFPFLFALFAIRMASSWLVEPRYALPFAALVLVAREEEPPWLEWSSVPLYGLATVWLFSGAVSGQWFPL